MSKILLAIPQIDDATADQAHDIAAESDDIDIAGRAVAANEVAGWLADADTEIDVVLLHQQLGPMPVFELARDLSRRFPDTGLVLLADDEDADMLRGAMFAGIRAVVSLPLALEELTNAVATATAWAQSVRERFSGLHERDDQRSGGAMYVFAGGKGGVGTTLVSSTYAVHKAVEHGDGSVCLVDLDLQAGDVRAYFDITHARSITDIVAVSHELTTRHLDESLFHHASGLRVLLPPLDGELGEDVDTAAARQILGALRSRFDLVIVDVGATMNEATATAVEMADHVVIVTTTNVPALRGTNRLVRMWDRLAIRREGISALINRVSRDNEVQPDLCSRVLKLPVMDITLSSDFRALESVINTGRLTDSGPWADAMDRLGGEIEQRRNREQREPATDEADRGARLRSRVASAQDGQSTAEFVAILPLLAIALLMAWQLALVGWAHMQVQEASRHAARQFGVSQGVDGDGNGVADDVDAAARSRLSGQTSASAQIHQRGSTVTVTVDLPSILPLFDNLGTVSASAGGVVEE